MRESVQVFIAPPEPGVLRERLLARGTDPAEAIDARLEVAEQELGRPGRVLATASSTTTEPRRRVSWS